MRLRVLTEVTRTVWREYARTPEAVFWTYGFPLLIALVLGFAFGEGRREAVHVAVDADADPAIRRVLEEHSAGRIEVQTLDGERAQRALTLGTVDLVVSGTVAEPRFELDPQRPGSELARLHVERAFREALGEVPTISAEIRTVDEPGDRYIDFLIAGLIGMNLLGGGMYGVGYNIVLMRSQKLLRRLAVTPMTKGEFLTAFLVSRTALAMPPPFVILAFGMLAFGVPVLGSWLAFVGFVLIGALVFSGLGLLVASRARTTESVSGLMNLVMMPMWLFGGVFFSNERFPDVLQPVVQAMPMTHFTDGLRGIMLGSFDAPHVAIAAAALVGLGVVAFGVAIRIFRWS